MSLDPAKDVVSAIQDAMITDDENQSERLIATYDKATFAQKVIIDEVLICLCGYSMPSLLGIAGGTDESEGLTC
jgi:hypothetical protein